MRRIWKKIERFFRYLYLRIVRVGTDPHSTALGLALGVFVGCLPIIPFQFVTVLVLTFFFRCNRVVALLGTLVSNPPTLPIFYFFLYRVGKVFVSGRVPKFNLQEMVLSELMKNGWDLVFVMMVGGLVVGIPAGIATYFVTLKTVRTYLRRKEARRLRKFMEQQQ